MQTPHAVADRLEHPAHLPVATFVQRHLDGRAVEAADAGRRGAAVLELDAVRELAQLRVGRLAPELGDVDLVDLVLRMREPVRERAVVRQQQRAGRVGVEAADGDDARRVRRRGRPPSGVPAGRSRS